jgi:alpha-beta hydrolase superfamily lysophospholipase
MSWKIFLIGTLNWKRLFRSLLLIYIIIIIFAYFYAEKLIFPYHQSSYDNNRPGLDFLKSEDGIKIATRFWKADNEKFIIIYFHGNYMDTGHLDDIAEKLNSHMYSVLAMDYRGYGLSQGEVNEANSYTDAQMVYEHVLTLGYNPENIIILGRSVGSGIATELAVNNKAKTLVLISPFTSTYRVMTKYPILLFDKFNNLAKIKKINKPLFIIHGENDQIIPKWHSEKLIKKHQGKQQRILVKGAGHNDIWGDEYSDFINQLDNFLGS